MERERERESYVHLHEYMDEGRLVWIYERTWGLIGSEHSDGATTLLYFLLFGRGLLFFVGSWAVCVCVCGEVF